MFITKKISKKSICAAVVILAVVIIFVVRLGSCGFSANTAESPNIGVYSLIADDNESCIDFLGQFGLTVEEDPLEVTKVKIPALFNETYEQYNELQKQQGLDLEPYKSKECQRRSYKVTGYNADTDVQANILIYDGMVIGGDVCSLALDGFMNTFDANSPD